MRGREVEDRREVRRWPLIAPVLARRRNGGEGKQDAEEVEVWRPRGKPSGGSFGRSVVVAWHCRRRKKTP
jgi:hypothetical protein